MQTHTQNVFTIDLVRPLGTFLESVFVSPQSGGYLKLFTEADLVNLVLCSVVW